MGKSWLKKDISELRKEQKEQVKKRDELSKKAEKRRVDEIVERKKMHDKELAKLGKPKPKPKEQLYGVKVWAKKDENAWKYDNLTRDEIDTFIERARGETDGYVRLGERRALLNLREIVVINIFKQPV